MDMVSAFKAWLPVPTYAFVGGPADGKRLSVRLIETQRGMEPLDFWQVPERDDPPPLVIENTVCNNVVKIHTYRFVQQGTFDEGFYEYVG